MRAFQRVVCQAVFLWGRIWAGNANLGTMGENCMKLTWWCGPWNASDTKQWISFSIDCAMTEVKAHCCSIISSAFWLPYREGANITIVRTAFCIVDYFKIKEKGKDPALNIVCVRYMNLIMLFGIRIGLPVFSISLHFLLKGKVLNRNGIFLIDFSQNWLCLLDCFLEVYSLFQ